MPDITHPIAVITCFVTKQDKILLLKRSEHVGSYHGHWAGVSGFVENEAPVKRAWIELEEELGIRTNDAELELEGKPIVVQDLKINCAWLIHPFRFALAPGFEPKLDWEHVEMRWVKPGEMAHMLTVPKLMDAWLCVSDGFGK